MNAPSPHAPPLHQLNKSDIFCCFNSAQCTELFMYALNNAIRIKNWINQNITLMSTLNSYHNRHHYENTGETSVYRTVADCVSYSTYMEPYSEEPQDLFIKPTKSSRKIKNRPPTPHNKAGEHIYENVDETHYYIPRIIKSPHKQQNEHHSNTGCSTAIKSTITRCVSSGQDSEGTDETDELCI